MRVTRPRSRRTGVARIGAVKGLGIGALCLVSAGIGAAAASGATFAADNTTPTAATGTADAAGDNQVIIDVVKAVSPAVVTINVTKGTADGAGQRCQRAPGLRPAGHRVGRHHRSERAHPDQPPRGPGRDRRERRPRRRSDLRLARSRASTPTPTSRSSRSTRAGCRPPSWATHRRSRSASWPSPWVIPWASSPAPSPRASSAASTEPSSVSDQTGQNPNRLCPPHPDRRGHQPRQLRRSARRRRWQGHRHRHGRDRLGPGHRLRHPHRSRQAHHHPGPGGPGHRSPLDRHLLPAARRAGRQGQQADRQRRRLDHTRRTAADGTKTDPIVKDGPAAKAGLKDGDIITAIDGQTIDAAHPLDLVLLTHAPGDKVTLTVLRDGAVHLDRRDARHPTGGRSNQ